ncbi:MAG: metalloregulator ArsR/SmtB family transcription factor [Candidatus Eisenbacteria bacterium]
MDAVFKALADPHRRRLLELLRERDGRTLADLDRHLPMTRFGTMKHLRLLEAAGLVSARRIGREKRHYLNADPIRELDASWLARFKTFAQVDAEERRRMREMLVRMFALAHGALHMNLEGITHEESLVQPQPGGNCIQWVVAHIVATRDQCLRLIGAEPVLPAELGKRFTRPAAALTDPGDQRPLADWIADLDRSQERIAVAVSAFPTDRLAEPFDGARLPGRPTTLAEALAFFHFHESYHVGQVGLLRRLVGRGGAIR